MNNKHYIGRDVRSLEHYDKIGPITGVSILVDEDNEYVAGDMTGYVFETTCPYGTQAMADTMLARLQGKVYKGFRATDAILDKDAELGDGITIDGEYAMLAYQEITFGPKHTSEIAAPGESILEHEYPYVGSTQKTINRKIAQVNSKITKTSEEIRLEVSNELENLSSSIDVKLGSITSTVQGLDSTVSSIEQKVDSIKINVTTKDGVSTIELTGTGITASSAEIDLSGFVTFTGLSGGTTTIDGSCIKTGTIDADRINLTGAIAWGDLSSSVQNKINNAGDTVPSYIKSTYIDFSSVSSPKIVGNEIITTGHFAVTGDVGGVASDLGYMGGANGLDAAGNTTYGVALSNGSPDGLGSGDNYLIVTNGGVRMQAGTHSLTVTSNGCYADDSLIGSGAATWG